ncbi:MAG: carboxypeptidase-like regulatory domain-containing protein [Thermoanaerobaculia bacterium]
MRNLTFAFAILVLVPLGIDAQTIPGSDIITGRVTDLTGRPVANAQIGVTSTRTGKTRTQSTDDNGRYRIYFPETAPNYKLLGKRMGFSPVQRTINRKSEGPEEMRVDLQFGGTPLALSDVEIDGSFDAPAPRETEKTLPSDPSVPNPVFDILALKDTLHLSAVQVVGLNDLADSLQSKNTRIYHDIRTLLAKSQAAGDVTQMTGTVTLMLEEASRNTTHAVVLALKLLRQEQFVVLPADIRGQSGSAEAATKQ